jgi:hypothetical protein
MPANDSNNNEVTVERRPFRRVDASICRFYRLPEVACVLRHLWMDEQDVVGPYYTCVMWEVMCVMCGGRGKMRQKNDLDYFLKIYYFTNHINGNNYHAASAFAAAFLCGLVSASLAA